MDDIVTNFLSRGQWINRVRYDVSTTNDDHWLSASLRTIGAMQISRI